MAASKVERWINESFGKFSFARTARVASPNTNSSGNIFSSSRFVTFTENNNWRFWERREWEGEEREGDGHTHLDLRQCTICVRCEANFKNNWKKKRKFIIPVVSIMDVDRSDLERPEKNPISIKNSRHFLRAHNFHCSITITTTFKPHPIHFKRKPNAHAVLGAYFMVWACFLLFCCCFSWCCRCSCCFVVVVGAIRIHK